MASTDLSHTLYASRRKELLALINQLRAVGAQNDLDLPRITVIGNQSAGKSSVVEAISGITVPRDAGTCTRCPMECRLLSSTGPWTCQISIRNEFDNVGNRLGEVSEIPFGGPITDKSHVELALRKAQFAVLNPGVSAKKILNATSAEELTGMATDKSQSFSKNVVCVDLQGPELTDLSFIDLPGLIQNAEPELVGLVEDMVVSHIEGNSLILIALPMTDDIENQKAVSLAKKVDRDGRRTIGVLTKPDILVTGSSKASSLWLDVLEDRRHPLRHGYYCTRQPNDDERSAGISADEARAVEEKFFKTTAPWSRTTSPGRFGIKNLVGSLSRLLVQIIDDNLPQIREETSKQLTHCRNELGRIPPPISEEPATYLLSLVTTFCSEFQTLVRGRADCAELIRLHRESYSKFMKTIRNTAPIFVPCVENHKVTDFSNCLSDEENDPVANVSVTNTPSMNLTDVKKHVDQSITRELPNNVPYEAKASLIVRFQATWPDAVKACFREVEDATTQILLTMVESHFGRFSLLQSHIRNFIKMLMEEHKKKCHEMLAATIEAEHMPYTQNGHYLETTTQAWLDKYKAIRSGYGPEVDADTKAKTQEVPQSTPLFQPSGASATVVNDKLSFSFSSASANESTASNAFFGSGSTTSPLFSKPTGTVGAQAASSSSLGASSVPVEAFGTPSGTPTGGRRWSKIGANTSQTPGTPSTMPVFTSVAPINETTSSHEAKGDSLTDEKTKTLQAVIGLLVQAGLSGASLNPTELLGKLTPPDEFEKELKVMAEVRGYFQVAYKRMIDNIPSLIDLLFVRRLGDTLQPFLISKFGMGTPSANERCASYLGEDPMLVANRAELLAKKKRLESVDKELDEYSLHL